MNAEVDGQPKSGSGVIEVTYKRYANWVPQEKHFVVEVRGEAFALDLGEKGKIFALLRGPMLGEDGTAPDGIINQVWDDLAVKYNYDWLAILRNAQGKRDVGLNHLPMLVRFRDTNDPTTMEFLKPQNLESNFGPGVKMTGATIEITRDEVTTGIVRQLPWLNGFMYEGRGKSIDFDLDGHLTSDPAAHGARLGSLEFIRGE
ncbi:MAG: hypothetical protein M3O03_06805 [Pseudomonadota bacterium]|nr:hypothetical protein [Pseudomonadota bacterium]